MADIDGSICHSGLNWHQKSFSDGSTFSCAVDSFSKVGSFLFLPYLSKLS